MGSSQLEDEIQEGSWLLVDFEEDVVIAEEMEGLWDRLLEKLGVGEAAFLLMGKAGDA